MRNWWSVGHWIWAPASGDETLQHVCFRRRLDCAVKPQAVRVGISADCVYRLWCNGRFVMHGPARSPLGTATVDEIALTPFLQTGPNLLAIEVIFAHPWEKGFPGQAPGLFAVLDLDGTILSGPDGWRCHRPHAYNVKAPRCGGNRPPVEIFDAGRLDPAWRVLDYDDLDWLIPQDLGPAGVAPWRTMVARDVPLLQLDWTAAAEPIRFARGSGEIGNVPEHFHDPSPLNDVAVRLHNEAQQPVSPSHRERACGEWLSGNGVLLSEANDDVTLDMGRVVSGFIAFEVEGRPGAVFDVAWHEVLASDGTVRPLAKVRLRQVARYTLRAGRQSFTLFSVQTLRYARLVNRGSGPLRVRSFGVMEFHSAPPTAGSFQCSDPLLNRIFDAARLTATLNTADVYMDSSNRERNGWFGDSYWTGLAHQLLSGDYSISRRMCRLGAQSFIAKLSRDFIPQRVPPAEQERWWRRQAEIARDCVAPYVPIGETVGIFIPAWVLYWLLQIGLDAYLQGTNDLGSELRDAIHRQLRALAALRNAEGLLENVPGWNFLDWSYSSCGYYTPPEAVSVGLNAIYARALDTAADLTDTPAYRQAAAAVRSALNRLCPGIVYPVMLERRNGVLTPSAEKSESTQYYALWCDVPDAQRRAALWKEMRDDFVLSEEYDPMSPDHPRVRGLERCSLYSYMMRLQFAASIGDREILLNNIRRTFGYMVAAGPGTLWEAMRNPTEEFCHSQGIASGVAVMLMESVLGVTPIRGMRRIRVAPGGAGQLSWCRGFVPAERGRIAVAWELCTGKEFRLSLGLPPGTKAEVVLPPEAHAIWAQRQSDSTWPVAIETGQSVVVTVRPGTVAQRLALP